MMSALSLSLVGELAAIIRRPGGWVFPVIAVFCFFALVILALDALVPGRTVPRQTRRPWS